MASPQFRRVLQFFAIAGMVGIFLLVSVHFAGWHANANALAQPAYQDDGYPPTEDVPTEVVPTYGYPGEESPTAEAGTTSTAGGATATSGPTPTPANTMTVTATVRNVFLTENAEMGASSVTPPASLTPLATGTIAPTHTNTPTRTPLSTLIAAASDEDQNLDWGLFWIGFSVPIIAACGVVLYLLDHRPELFSFKRK